MFRRRLCEVRLASECQYMKPVFERVAPRFLGVHVRGDLLEGVKFILPPAV